MFNGKINININILMLSVSSEENNNYRKTDSKKMSILLVKRIEEPFKDYWDLPNGYIKVNENLDDAPKRILQEKTSLENIYLEQLYTFGECERTTEERLISTAYIALIDKNKTEKITNKDMCWFDIISYEEKNNLVEIVLNNNNETIKFKIERVLRDYTTDRYSFKILENKSLAFDNPRIILAGLERLKNKIQYTDIVFNMMPKYFTLGELQQVYEVILGKKLLDPAFRRIIANKVSKTNKMKTGGGHRPSVLFEYKKQNKE